MDGLLDFSQLTVFALDLRCLPLDVLLQLRDFILGFIQRLGLILSLLDLFAQSLDVIVLLGDLV